MESKEILMRGKIEKLVQDQLRAREAELNSKRDRLKSLYNLEDSVYEREAKLKVSEKISKELAERRNRILALKQERETQEREFLKQKKMQQYMAACDEVRPYLRQKLLVDSKACNLAQIDERRKQQLVERENQNMWLEIARRTNARHLEAEMQEKRQRKLWNENTADFLKQQMTEKRLNGRQKFAEMAEEQRRAEEVMNKEMVQETNEKRDLHKKKIKLATDLKEQLQQAAADRMARNAKEEEIDRIFQESVKREIEKEKSVKKTEAEIIKQETMQYLDYLKKIRKEREMEEAEKEKIINDYRGKMEQEAYKKRKDEFLRRMSQAAQIYESQRNQIKERKELEKMFRDKEFQEAVEERNILNRNAQMEELERQKQKLGAKQYGVMLKEQESVRKLQQKIEKERQDEELRQILEERRVCEEEAKRFVAENIDVLPQHPNTKIMTRKSDCEHLRDHVVLIK